MLDSQAVKYLKPQITKKLTPPKYVEGLNILIEKKNKVTKQLNNLYKGISTLEKVINIPTKIIDTSEKSIPPLKAGITATAFIPSTATTPIPVGPILIAKDTIKILEDLIDLSKSKLSVGNIQLSFLKSELTKVIDLLGVLDLLIQASAKELNANNSLSTQDMVSNDLTRRQAVARNSQGVIMLQGDQSFSSNDQILIDELVYYIQQNDLKA